MTQVLKLDEQVFLSEYWQQKPLFISDGLSPFSPPADADELAGLALESEADSRIIACVDGRWAQELGPFHEQAFLRKGAWSLLVQSVDQHWDDAAELLQAVAFLPGWRLDDVMMSYANDGGSAGPHFDNYDVFIIQGDGQRRWQLGQRCTPASSLLPHSSLSLLADFQVSDEYVMSCGDVLYIPPGVAHYGVSLGESTSFSIGFRAPRISDLLARWTDLSLEKLSDFQLLRDPGRKIAGRAGEISPEDLRNAQVQLIEYLTRDDPRWFGETITHSESAAHANNTELPALTQGPDEDIVLCKTPDGRMAWYDLGDEILVFAHGNSLRVSARLQPIVEALCRDEPLAAAESLALHPGSRDLLNWLIAEGALMSVCNNDDPQ